MSDEKSILDSLPVDDKAFPLRQSIRPARQDIVGHCPHCGSPIFGPLSIVAGEIAQITYSCHCLRKEGLTGQISTK